MQRPRGPAGAAIVTGAVVVVIIVVVAALAWAFIWGRYEPSPPSLADRPQPIPGTIAFVDGDGCIDVAEASGASRRTVACPGAVALVSWTNDRMILYAIYDTARVRWAVLDPASGASTPLNANAEPYELFQGDDLVSPLGERASFDEGGDLIITGADGVSREAFDYRGRSGYHPAFLTWSPDGRFVALHYARDNEIWLVAADGSFAGTLAREAIWSPWAISWRIDGVGFRPERAERPGLP